MPNDNKWRNIPEVNIRPRVVLRSTCFYFQFYYQYVAQLDSLRVNLKSNCEKLPYLGMDESCAYSFDITNQHEYYFLFLDDLTISDSEATLQSFSIWGMLRGLESFSQLLYVAPDSRSVSLFRFSDDFLNVLINFSW